MSVVPLHNVGKVYLSLTTPSPLYLGQGFVIHNDPQKRKSFAQLISCLSRKHPHYPLIRSILEAIEIVQNPAKVSCLNQSTAPSELPQWQNIPRVTAAASPVLSQSQIFEAQRLQYELSAMIGDVQKNITIFNARCLHKMADYVLSKATHLNISRKFGLDSEKVAIRCPSTNSTESLALFLRWMPSTNQGSHVRTLALPTRNDICDLVHLRDSTSDEETRNMANYILLMMEHYRISQMCSQELAKIPPAFHRHKHATYPNDKSIGLSCKWFKAVHADYIDKYKQLEALQKKSPNAHLFASNYGKILGSAYPLPQDLNHSFSSLSLEAAVKSTGDEFHAFLQENCGIDCSSYIDPMYGPPALTTSYAPFIFPKPVTAGPVSCSPSPTWIFNYSPVMPRPTPDPLKTSSSPQGTIATQAMQSRTIRLEPDSECFPYSIYPIRYHERVAHWFTNPLKILFSPKYRN
ncbi:MAG TPA: hypothetical protein VGO47_07035, partial [Chlamydiales bacterium]|nr:hypothetical protein [Chlamydiales bacterium]